MSNNKPNQLYGYFHARMAKMVDASDLNSDEQ